MTSPDQAQPSRLQPVMNCCLCGQPGQPLHAGLTDPLGNVPGPWNFRGCVNPACGLLWLDPMPDAATLTRAYQNYYTHAPAAGRPGWAQRIYRKLVALTPVGRERQRLAVMYLDTTPPGRVLEVGCGNGQRLTGLRARGWDVQGQEIDSLAGAVARDHFGLPVHLGPISELAGGYDAIILNHVIEHVPDPVDILAQCRRLLRDSGTLVLTTPNVASYGHQRFGACWRELDPPRHLHLFTTSNLRQAAQQAGFLKLATWTTSARVVGIGLGRRRGVWAGAGALWFQLVAAVHQRSAPDTGEECVLQATK